LVLGSITTLPALSLTSTHTLVFSPSAYTKVDAKARVSTAIICFMLIPYSNGCGAGIGAGLPPNPTVTEIGC
jgi:hypothetical protein